MELYAALLDIILNNKCTCKNKGVTLFVLLKKNNCRCEIRT